MVSVYVIVIVIVFVFVFVLLDLCSNWRNSCWTAVDRSKLIEGQDTFSNENKICLICDMWGGAEGTLKLPSKDLLRTIELIKYFAIATSVQSNINPIHGWSMSNNPKVRTSKVINNQAANSSVNMTCNFFDLAFGISTKNSGALDRVTEKIY